MVGPERRARPSVELDDAREVFAHVGRKAARFIVDPFVETHAVDENDNAQIKAVAVMWREMAQRCRCAVVLVHNTGKRYVRATITPGAAPGAALWLLGTPNLRLTPGTPG